MPKKGGAASEAALRNGGLASSCAENAREATQRKRPGPGPADPPTLPPRMQRRGPHGRTTTPSAGPGEPHTGRLSSGAVRPPGASEASSR